MCTGAKTDVHIINVSIIKLHDNKYHITNDKMNIINMNNEKSHCSCRREK